MIKGAVISTCTRYRYRLWRHWDETKHKLVFVMLNPSTANEYEDDPTIRKCMGFAERLGFGGIEVVNLFAYRATDPKELLQRVDQCLSMSEVIGPDNDRHIIDAVTIESASVVFAWGAHAERYDWRANNVVALCAEHRVKPVCLGFSKYRYPRHPLMLPYATPLEGYVG